MGSQIQGTLLLGKDDKEMRLDTFLSRDGIGGNKFERAALMHMIHAHKEYNQDSSSLKQLKSYRKALADSRKA